MFLFLFSRLFIPRRPCSPRVNSVKLSYKNTTQASKLMGSGTSVIRPEPQLPIGAVMPLFSALCDSHELDPVDVFDVLEGRRLLPHNTYDLWTSFGLDGTPPCNTRGSVIALIRSRLIPRND